MCYCDDRTSLYKADNNILFCREQIYVYDIFALPSITKQQSWLDVLINATCYRQQKNSSFIYLFIKFLCSWFAQPDITITTWALLLPQSDTLLNHYNNILRIQLCIPSLLYLIAKNNNTSAKRYRGALKKC